MTTLLDEAIEAWEDARHGVIAELENIPANRFDLTPAPGTRSVGELALHIAEVSLMMVGELTRGDGDFRRAPFPKLIAEYRAPLDGLTGKREILAALKRTLKEGVRAFRDAGELQTGSAPHPAFGHPLPASGARALPAPGPSPRDSGEKVARSAG